MYSSKCFMLQLLVLVTLNTVYGRLVDSLYTQTAYVVEQSILLPTHHWFVWMNFRATDDISRKSKVK